MVNLSEACAGATIYVLALESLTGVVVSDYMDREDRCHRGHGS